MLILVSVTISMAINGNLFSYAGKGAKETEQAKQEEQEISSGRVQVDGVWYDSLQDVADKSKGDKVALKEYAKANFSNGYLTENATYKSGEYIAVIPKGFKISDVSGENAIDTGLVIKDAEGNEFVWIPVSVELKNSYTYSEEFSEPAIISEYDTAKGYTQEGFENEYKAMVDSVNENKGFYIGRYEATIDDNNKVGTKYGTSILISNEWYSLYENAKKANVPNNGTNVQTAMIYGVLWDETMAYITAKDSNYDVNAERVEGYEGYNSNIEKLAGTFSTADKTLNVWGLGSSFTEWTQEKYANENYEVRVPRSGSNWSYVYKGEVYGFSYGSTASRSLIEDGYEYYYLSTGADFNSGDPIYSKPFYLSTRLVMYVL